MRRKRINVTILCAHCGAEIRLQPEPEQDAPRQRRLCCSDVEGAAYCVACCPCPHVPTHSGVGYYERTDVEV